MLAVTYADLACFVFLLPNLRHKEKSPGYSNTQGDDSLSKLEDREDTI